MQQPLNDNPTGGAAVKRILQPVIDPLLRLCREVRGVEEDKIKPAPKAGEEIGSHCIQSFLPCAECRMRIDVGYHDITVLYERRGDPTGAGADLQHPIPGPYLGLCCLKEQKRVGLGLVYLRRIIGHDRKCRAAGEKGIASSCWHCTNQYEGTGEREDQMDGVKLKWLVDLLLGITFVICFITGLLKYTVLLQLTGLSIRDPSRALISNLHDWSGILLGLFVFFHLLLNRRWIISTTKKILAGSRKEP